MVPNIVCLLSINLINPKEYSYNIFLFWCSNIMMNIYNKWSEQTTQNLDYNTSTVL